MYQSVKRGEKLFFSLIVTFLFLGASDFINRYYVCVFLAFFLFVITPGRRFRLNTSFAVLMLLSTSVVLFNPISTTTVTNMIKPFAYPLCYLMGFSLLSVRKRAEDGVQNERELHRLFFWLSVGPMIHFALNMFANESGGDSRREELIDFWTGREMSATGQAALVCLMIALLSAYLFSPVGKKKKIFAILSLVLILAYNLVLAGRTIFLLAGIMILVAAFYFGIEKKKFWKIFFIITFIVILLLVLFSLDFLGIETAMENSNFYNRFFGESGTQEIDSDARMAHKLAYITRMDSHFWGGGHIREEYGHSAHDLYLDTYDESGVFAFLAIGCYILITLSRMIMCVRNKRFSFATRQMLLCFYVAVNIQFWLEPIMRGMPWLLATYCFLDGVVTHFLAEDRDATVFVGQIKSEVVG